MSAFLKYAFVLLLFAAPAASAQPSAVEAPKFKKGDRCHYITTNDFTQEVISEQMREVLEVSDKIIRSQWWNNQTKNRRGQTLATPEGNVFEVSAPSVNLLWRYAPHNRLYDFPLTVGKCWGGETRVNQGAGDFVWNIQSCVLGWEKAKDRAGNLRDTLKIERTVHWYYTLQETRNGTTSATRWYDPNIGCTVRQNVQESRFGGYRNAYTTELVEHEPGK